MSSAGTAVAPELEVARHAVELMQQQMPVPYPVVHRLVRLVFELSGRLEDAGVAAFAPVCATFGCGEPVEPRSGPGRPPSHCEWHRR